MSRLILILKSSSIFYIFLIISTFFAASQSFSQDVNSTVSDLKKRQSKIKQIRRIMNDIETANNMSDEAAAAAATAALAREMHKLNKSPIPLSVRNPVNLIEAIDNISNDGFIDPNDYLHNPEVRDAFGLPPLSPSDIAKKQFDDSRKILSSPIILDLDGDGVETLPVSRGIYFDLSYDGFAERTGWVSADDGLLVRDLDNDGLITSGIELFGDQTYRYVFPFVTIKYDSYYANGFDALAQFDDNLDGVIDSSDEIFLELFIWKDKNEDAITDSGELISLPNAGVASINLDYKRIPRNAQYSRESGEIPPGNDYASQAFSLPFGITHENPVDDNGNEHLQISTYTTTDGQLRSAHDVWFDVNESDAFALEDSLPISSEIMSLPDIRGYGYLTSLWQKMESPEGHILESMVRNFIQTSTAYDRRLLINDIVFEWAGTSSLGSNNRHVDNERCTIKMIGTMEKVIGHEWIGGAQGIKNFGVDQSETACKSFQTFSNFVYAQLVSQTILKPLYDMAIFEFDENSLKIKADLTSVANQFILSFKENPVEAKLTLHEFVQSLEMLGMTPNIDMEGFRSKLEILGYEYISLTDTSGSTIVGENLVTVLNENIYADDVKIKTIHGFGGNDQISANSSNNFIYGGSGLDIIYAYGGNDFIDGGNDSDTIFAGSGDDKAIGGKGDDSVYGGEGNDILFGGHGNDSLQGEFGNDTLDGGPGDDLLSGDSGNDIYVYGIGYGNDRITESGGNDTLLLNEPLTINDVFIYRSLGHLWIKIIETEERLKVTDFFSWGGARIESVKLSNGDIITREELLSVDFVGTKEADYLTANGSSNILWGLEGDDFIDGKSGDDILYGGDGNDELIGRNGDDILIGGIGNDLLNGGNGNDRFKFSIGNGTDTIRQNDRSNKYTDVLEIGDGFEINNILVYIQGNNRIIEFNNSSDQIILERWERGPRFQLDKIEIGGIVYSPDEFFDIVN